MKRICLSVIILIICTMLTCSACMTGETISEPSNTTEVNTFGNTSGNHANGAFVAVQGDWVYIILENYLDSSTRIVSKRSLDDTEETYWFNTAAGSLNVVGDELFYIDNASREVYKSQTDGKKRMGTSIESGSDFQVVGDWVYYLSFDDGSLFKARTDGKRKKRIMKDYSYNRYFYVDGNRIFYTTAWVSDDPMGLYSVGTNGKGKTALISEQAVRCFVVDKDWIYYVLVSPDSQITGIWKMRKDGSEKTKISEDVGTTTGDGGKINIADGWIYYCNIFDDIGIHKIRTDGTERTKLNDDITDNLCLAGDWIYYRVVVDSQQPKGDLYRVRKDGTDRQKVTIKDYVPQELPTYFEN